MAIETFKGKIKDLVNLTPSVRLFKIDLEKEFNFKAGQFINLEIINDGIKYVKPYSICSSPKESYEIELCIKLVDDGNFTPKLFEKNIGDELTFKGPFGLFTLDKSDSSELIFVGTGTGVAPLRSMIKYLLEQQKEVHITLITGTSYENEILFKGEFEKLEEKNPNFKFRPVASKPSENYFGRKGYVQDNLENLDLLNSNVFICGLPIMIENVKTRLIELGINPENIYFEKY